VAVRVVVVVGESSIESSSQAVAEQSIT
jgi:hypothetical protein